MKTLGSTCMIVITALCVVVFQTIGSSFAEIEYSDSLFLNRSSFPPGFIFGLASSAYQSEGAAFQDGKGPSIWDTFTHQFPEEITDRSNGDVADNFYHRYKEDVKLLKLIGVDTFRMSISWPRILPRGKLSGGVNKDGISFYNNVFNELLANDIFPFVTLYHWDLPQALEDEYGGFLSPLIIDDYKDFAELCFKEFGDRVKYWITFNEPYFVSSTIGNFGTNRCSNSSFMCAQRNSATHPYTVAHNILLSHAATVKLYKKKYQGVQRGKIGITLNSLWYVPSTNSIFDIKAAQRALDFMYGWFLDPVVYGNYPRIMQSLVGNRLPNFTKKESAMLKGSIDFLGLNYYTSNYASNILKRSGNITSSTDSMVQISATRNGVPIGELTGSNYYVYPKGLYDLLVYTKEKYNNLTIHITENGIGDRSNDIIEQNIKDPQRINFFNRHLQAVRRAIREGVNVKSFIAWAFTDNFEWQFGYTIRFGFFYVDYKNDFKRIPKQSAFWFKSFLIN